MSIETHTLSNGIRMVAEHMPGLQSASLGVWISAGSRHEADDETGIAHFLEHMAFKGTETRSSLDIAECIENVGGYLNAYTSREVTAYYARVLSSDVALALDLISDILINPTFAEDELEVERGVILQEIGQTLDTPDDLIFDWLQDVSYPEQPFGRSILGPGEFVSRFSRDDLIRFVNRHYTPSRMILSAAGGIDPEAIFAQAETLFGGLTARAAPDASPAAFRGGEKREEKPLEQAHLALAFESPGYTDDAMYLAQVYGTALGGGMSSRLFQEARERRGLCYTIGAHNAAYRDTGSMTIYAGTGGGQIHELIDVTVAEMRRAADDFSEAEIDRARAQIKAGLLMGLESPSARCERLARATAVWGRVPDISESVAKIDAVTAGAARDFARDMLSKPPALALYGPISAAQDQVALSAGLLA